MEEIAGKSFDEKDNPQLIPYYFIGKSSETKRNISDNIFPSPHLNKNNQGEDIVRTAHIINKSAEMSRNTHPLKSNLSFKVTDCGRKCLVVDSRSATYPMRIGYKKFGYMLETPRILHYFNKSNNVNRCGQSAGKIENKIFSKSSETLRRTLNNEMKIKSDLNSDIQSTQYDPLSQGEKCAPLVSNSKLQKQLYARTSKINFRQFAGKICRFVRQKSSETLRCSSGLIPDDDKVRTSQRCKEHNRNVYASLNNNNFNFNEVTNLALPVYDKDIKCPATIISKRGRVPDTVLEGERITIPTFDIASYPQVRFSEAKARRYNLIDRAQQRAKQNLVLNPSICKEPLKLFQDNLQERFVVHERQKSSETLRGTQECEDKVQSREQLREINRNIYSPDKNKSGHKSNRMKIDLMSIEDSNIFAAVGAASTAINVTTTVATSLGRTSMLSAIEEIGKLLTFAPYCSNMISADHRIGGTPKKNRTIPRKVNSLINL